MDSLYLGFPDNYLWIMEQLTLNLEFTIYNLLYIFCSDMIYKYCYIEYINCNKKSIHIDTSD